MRHRAHETACPWISVLPALVALAALPGCYIDDAFVEYNADAGVNVPACLTDADCDDQNPCTIDTCAPGSCSHAPALAGTACGDAADLCHAAPACDGNGACAPGAATPTDDGNACTVDACDLASGIVTHTPVSGCTVPTGDTGAPAPRRLHTAVWTGDRMIIWGGSGSGSPAALATGGIYDPAAGTWKATSTTGAPPPRHSHCAVWTGSKMIVWGGFGASALETTGGAYDPAADAWTATSTTGAPTGRTGFACAWTGKEMVVWGGTASGAVVNTGGRYDPATDTWKPLPAAGAPAPRYNASGLWSGTRFLVWGGNALFDWHADGAAYDPTADAWAGVIPKQGAPSAREQHTAVWTGSRMVVWGGFTGGVYVNDGGAWDPGAGSWSALSVTGAPSARTEHAAVWTGNRMIVWGGCGQDSCTELYADGGVWAPDATGGSWTAIAASPDVPARRGPTAVWTGSAVVVWGGRTSKGETGTGAVIYP
jgi:N-acetylneuraminic acid mutarotase